MLLWKYLTLFLALAKTGVLGAAIKPFDHGNRRSQETSRLLPTHWPEVEYEWDSGLPTADSFHSRRHERKLQKEREELLKALLKTFTPPSFLEDDSFMSIGVKGNKKHHHNFNNDDDGEEVLRRVRKHLTSDGVQRVTRSYDPCLSGIGGGNRLCEYEPRTRTAQSMGMRKLYEFLARWNRQNDDN